MAKFVIECPSCGKYAEASTFIFAKKKITCSCGHIIDVRTESLTSRVCVHCGNDVIYDQRKGENAKCPVCHNNVCDIDSMSNLVQFSCPSCSCRLSADKNAKEYTCPLCDTRIDVQQQIGKEKISKKGIASVIKYEGDNSTFVWKHPIEDFNLGSQLIVHESQEAIFFRDGKALDLFGAGRYTLTTQNIPLLEELYKLPTNADTIFHSEVYFINQTVQMGIKWGTDSKVRLFDPATGLHIEIGACGNFSLRVKDSRKLLIKLVGTTGGLASDSLGNTVQFPCPSCSHMLTVDKNVKEYTCPSCSKRIDVPVNGRCITNNQSISMFKPMIMTKVKSNLAKAITENKINILEVDAHLDEISETLKQQINPILDEYGLYMPEFYVTTLQTPDDDPNFKRMREQHAEAFLNVRQEEILKATAEASAERQFVEARTAAQLEMIKAQGEAEAYRLRAQAEADEMRMKGYTYQQETARQVGIAAMENMGGDGGGVGGGIGDVAGLGIALGTMGGVINMTRDAIAPITNASMDMGAGVAATITDTWECSCGQKASGKFCNNCGAKRPEPADAWDCSCGQRGITAKFCNNCGAKRPEPAAAWDCACGRTGITAKFCDNCGAKRPEPAPAWDCACGRKGITAKFCDNCGAKKPEPAETWDCTCGRTGITAKFCDNCGAKKPDAE
ncbi:MAG: SPFH domain-containing protein [Oscillospiraceae bacterium]